jgi:hypothetical protein
MANQWLRLWHDMPNDPKWRTIARISAQPISTVIAVYVHLLVDASRNVTRGHVTVTKEDIASAIDLPEDAISAVLTAMEGRVLSQGRLTGWEERQPKKEDAGDAETGAKSAAERKREQREREKSAGESKQESKLVTDSHDESRNVTLDKDKEEDTDKKDQKKKTCSPVGSRFDEFWSFQLRVVDKKKCRAAWDKRNLDLLADVIIPKAKAYNASIEDVKFCKHPLTWLNGECWNDEILPRQNAPPPKPSKLAQGLETLERMKHGLVQNRNTNGITEAGFARLGVDSTDGDDSGYGRGLA